MTPSASSSTTCLQLEADDDENTLWAFGPVGGHHTNWLPTNPSPYCHPVHGPSQVTAAIAGISIRSLTPLRLPATFPRFPDLPPELRSRIWSLALLSSFTNPTGMTMATLDARLDLDQPARVLDSEFHLLLSPTIQILSSCREARNEGLRAIAQASKVVGLRVLLGKGRLDCYYDRTYRGSHSLRWLKPLLPGVETLCMDLPRLYQGDAVFQSKESFVQTLKNAAGTGMKRLCLGAAVFGDPLYNSYDGSAGSESGSGRNGCPYGSVTTKMVQKHFERGVTMFPRAEQRLPSLPADEKLCLPLTSEDNPLCLSAQRSGRQFVEIARVERDGTVKVAGDLPRGDEISWDVLFDGELVPIMEALRDEFPLLERVCVMTESQDSVLRTFRALGWKYRDGNVRDGM